MSYATLAINSIYPMSRYLGERLSKRIMLYMYPITKGSDWTPIKSRGNLATFNQTKFCPMFLKQAQFH